MDNQKIGNLIKELRLKNNMTQLQLANLLLISDRAVSKWERGLGCPDISLIPDIAEIFKINIEELLNGNIKENKFVGGNMKKINYYVCPVCGNISICTGNAQVSCCSKKLLKCTEQVPDEGHSLTINNIEDELFIESNHEMIKEHYISFVAFATGEKVEIIKQYPEWNLQIRLPQKRHGKLLWYCTKHGLFYKNI